MPASTHPILPALVLCMAVSLSAADRTEGLVSVSNGERITISDYVVPGKTTILSFMSEFSPPCPCDPCTALGDPLQALQDSRDDLVVVKVDINRTGITKIDWNSPVAQQFGLRRLPHFIVYGPDGSVVAEDDTRTDGSVGRELVHNMLISLSGHQVAAGR